MDNRPNELMLRKLALYHCVKNLRSFMAFWGKRLRGEYQLRYYLMPMKQNPIVGQRSDSIIYGGRVTGKSWDMELAMAHAMLNRPDGKVSGYREREVILTGARDVHISQRCEPLFDMFNAREPLWKTMVTTSRRKPYELRLRNGSFFMGISVGNDPTAKNLEGPHPWRRFIEETAHFPDYAWKKFQDTAHEGGTVDTFIGVCDGRIDTPYYRIDHNQYQRYVGRQYHIPQYMNPAWNADKKQQRVYDMKGEDSDAYVQQVGAEWGSPAEGIWDLKDLRASVADLPYTEVVWTPRDLRDRVKIGKVQANIHALVQSLPKPVKAHDSYIIAMDPGYTQDGEIIVFGRLKGSTNVEHPVGTWTMFVRVILRNRVIHQDATYVLHCLTTRFHPKTVGIDATGEQGKDISNTLMDRENAIYTKTDYTNLMHLYEGQANVVTGHQMGEDKYGVPEEQELKQGVKMFSTAQVAGWFAAPRNFSIPRKCLDFIPAFNAEAIKITIVGNKIIETPADIHMPDVYRVFFMTWHDKFGRVDAPSQMSEIALPIVARNPSLARVRL